MFGPVDSLMWGGTGLYLGGQCPVGTSCLLSILLWTSLWLGAGMGAVGGGDIALGGGQLGTVLYLSNCLVIYLVHFPMYLWFTISVFW
jgi:hypothetical protein